MCRGGINPGANQIIPRGIGTRATCTEQLPRRASSQALNRSCAPDEHVALGCAGDGHCRKVRELPPGTVLVALEDGLGHVINQRPVGNSQSITLSGRQAINDNGIFKFYRTIASCQVLYQITDICIHVSRGEYLANHPVPAWLL